MGLFRRKDREADDVEAEDAVETAETAEPVEDVPVAGRPQGPWDEADAPDDAVQRLDLGALRVPMPPQTEVRVEVDQAGKVVAATLVRGPSAMQLSAFAAPRTEGIWDEVREEIGTALVQGGGQAEDVPGELGTELRATVPTEVPGRGRTLVPARFLGVDGPRWFLRAMITGPAATEREPGAELEQALRGVVVVRGSDPMAVRDPLPLQLPKDVQAAAQQRTGQAGGEPARPAAPGVPERGPEITETR